MVNKLFKPYMYVKDIYSIDYDKLFNKGIKGIMYDIDNTLISYDEEHAHDKIIELMEYLNNNEIKVAFVSNGPKNRVNRFNKKFNYLSVYRAMKPFSQGLKKAMFEMNLKVDEVLMIGDQIFTDVLAANKIGVKCILVKPIKPKDTYVEKIKRKIEKSLIKKFKFK